MHLATTINKIEDTQRKSHFKKEFGFEPQILCLCTRFGQSVNHVVLHSKGGYSQITQLINRRRGCSKLNFMNKNTSTTILRTSFKTFKISHHIYTLHNTHGCRMVRKSEESSSNYTRSFLKEGFASKLNKI